MPFEDAVAVLRSWLGEHVVVTLEPDGTVMRGALAELDSEGTDGALFALDSDQMSGVAVALFRDGVTAAVRTEDRLMVRQGRMTITVTRGH